MPLPASILENLNSLKRLGITIVRKLNFNEHVTNLCDKASKKIQALAGVFPYIPQTQKRLLMNAYFMSQFGYCPLVWMNHSRTLNNRINGLHKRALSLVYNDFSSSFSELLEKDKSVTIHHRNLQTLAYEIFKVKDNMVPEILAEISRKKESNYSLRDGTALKGRSFKTAMNGSETSLGPQIWDILTTELKKLCLLNYSKRKFVNGSQRTKHWISASYLYCIFCSVS